MVLEAEARGGGAGTAAGVVRFAGSSADVKSPTDGFYFIAAHQASL